MSALRQRNDPVRLMWRRAGLLGLFIVVAVAVYNVWGVYWKNQESIALKSQAQDQYAQLSQHETQLSAGIAELQSEHGVEAALRDEYGMAAAGEGEIDIVESSSAPTVTTASTTFIDRIKALFRGL